MKKLTIILAFAAFATAASAQYVVGGKVGFGTASGSFWSKETRGNQSVEYKQPADIATTLTIAPKFGYQVNNRMQVGLSLGYYLESAKVYSVYDEYYEEYSNFKGYRQTTTQALEVAPYLRYTFVQMEKLGIFAEAQLAVQFGFNPRHHNYRTAAGDLRAENRKFTDPSTSLGIGLQVVPGVNYKLADHCSLDLYIDLASVGYAYMVANTKVVEGDYTHTTKAVASGFVAGADLSAQTLDDHLSLFRLGFNYHF